MKKRKSTKQELINKGVDLLHNSFRRDFNSVRINVHNSPEHEVAKTLMAYELIKDGYDVLTEAIFKNKKKADIFIPETMVVYEILHTETKQEALKKTESYPAECMVWMFTSSEIIKNGLLKNQI